MVKLPMRRRTRSSLRTHNGEIPGKARLFHVQILKSVMVIILGVAAPGSIS